jgi:2-keto-4-pentenoate hydratase/2-oxohepta-3-ene-1,7-dioic acid hydratase in catechol pathway
MPQYAFAPVAVPSVPLHGEYSRFPVHRIYCVGRNFAEHAREMGAEAPGSGEKRGSPVIFMKPGDAVVTDGRVPYPGQTRELHHEVELVVALGRDAPRGELSAAQAQALVFGYGVGLDLTRRDLQAELKEKRLPWDIAKGFDGSAPVSALVPAAQVAGLGAQRLWLEVNGETRQQAPLSDMIFGVTEVLQHLSRLYALRAGDLVFMGTPSGVAALQPGDRFRAGIDGLVEFSGEILPA